MGDFLFFGTKKYFFGVKIERKNRKCREFILFRRQKYFYLIQKYFRLSRWSLRVREHSRMTWNLSTPHQKGTGQVMI